MSDFLLALDFGAELSSSRDDPNDPYNWAGWRKNLLLFQVAVHAMMGPFSAAAVSKLLEALLLHLHGLH